MAVRREDFQKDFARVVTKAWKDPKFKKQLLDNPDATLKKEGFDIPRGFHCEFHENTERVLHFTLPKRPEEKLSDDQLLKVAAAMTVLPINLIGMVPGVIPHTH